MWLPRDQEFTAELVIQRSRFLAIAARATTEDAARALVARQRSAHPAARHHCSAFVVEVAHSQPVVRSSDDGEPAGTAGMPMLEVLRGSGYTNIAVVVVRYFGGIKLGTGGLVRAYAGAVSEVLRDAPAVEPVRRKLFTLSLDHADAGRVIAELSARGIEVADIAYGQRAVLTLVGAPELVEAVALATRGAGQLQPAGERLVEVPVAR